MAGTPDNKRTVTKPFLIAKDAEGGVRLTVRETRYNGQGYPIVTSTPVAEVFPTANAARAHAKAHFGAVAGDFATK
jgi:hypothetical protein